MIVLNGREFKGTYKAAITTEPEVDIDTFLRGSAAMQDVKVTTVIMLIPDDGEPFEVTPTRIDCPLRFPPVLYIDSQKQEV